MVCYAIRPLWQGRRDAWLVGPRIKNLDFSSCAGIFSQAKGGPMSLTPGATLGAYEILSAIGAGGMGDVYRGRDAKLGRDVSSKALPEEFTQSRSRSPCKLADALMNTTGSHRRRISTEGGKEPVWPEMAGSFSSSLFSRVCRFRRTS